jgi:hypothetical protein
MALAAWGPAAWFTQRRFTEQTQYSVHGLPARAPPEIFLDSVVRPSFDLPLVFIALIAIFLMMLLIKSARRLLRRDKAAPLNQYFLFYLAAWATVPCLLVYLFYFASGWERYVSRYLSICVPPFTILLVLSLEQFVMAWGAGQIRRHYLRISILYAILACAILALPGAYLAARDPKGVYRDIARSIVMTIEQDPRSSFAIFDAARQRRSLLDYYVRRFSKTVRVDGTFRKTDERPGRDPLKHVSANVKGRDYLIVAFPFDGADKFPVLVAALNERYDLVLNQLDGDGLGYLLFKSRHADR